MSKGLVRRSIVLLRHRETNAIQGWIPRPSMPCFQMQLRPLQRRKQNTLNKPEMPQPRTVIARLLGTGHLWLRRPRQLSQHLPMLTKRLLGSHRLYPGAPKVGPIPRPASSRWGNSVNHLLRLDCAHHDLSNYPVLATYKARVLTYQTIRRSHRCYRRTAPAIGHQ